MQLKNTVFLLLIIGMGMLNTLSAQAPANDDCANAETIVIANNGFGLGNFTSTQVNITNGTVQTGESFAPAIFVAGLDDKSVWFKFTLPTIRAVRVTLSQPGTAIAAGDVGFAVYRDNNCIPTNDSISTKLTPIVTWGNTYHPCVPAGEYLVQVSSNLNANGPVTITVEISDQTGAAYDHPVDAYAFGVANVHARRIDFETECQSIEDETEVCGVLHNYQQYHKSAWFTFTTPAYLDYLVVSVSGTGSPRYFPSGANNIQKKFGYNLYSGNAVTTPIGSLTLVDGCDSMLTNGDRAATQQYGCGVLQPNTTYSIQLFIHKDFNDMVRLGIITGGAAPAAGPLPVNTLPATNAVGVLPSSGAGTTTTVYDNFGCNSRHSVNPCSPSKPAAGTVVGNATYNLSTFFSFSLSRTVAITFRPSMINCGPRPVIRLFKQTLTANCADLDTLNIVGTAAYNQEIECLAPGDYVLQVLGIDTPANALNTLNAPDITNSEKCLFTNLGSRFQVQLVVYNRQAASNYSLYAPGRFDSINRVGAVQLPLVEGITYRASLDTIGCQPTLRPWDTTCSPLNDKIIYRQFIVADSGTVTFDDMIYSNNPLFRYKLYAGDANALASAQNVFSFPDRISGIVPKSLCIDGAEYCQNKSACVVPGTYTFASMGNTGTVGFVDRPSFTLRKTRTVFNSLQNALDMGSIMDTLGPNGGTIRGRRDYWSCDDNAIPINGYSPCAIAGRPATKAIYRQFYLKEDAIIRFSNPGYGGWCVGQQYGTRTLFSGKATDGMAGLSPMGNQWNCFSTASTTNNCAPLQAGWYTLVSWGTGPSYDSTMKLTNIGNNYNGYVSYFDEVDITITPACPGPKFNRPHKASVAAGATPHLIQWGTRAISTPVYPRTDTSFTLPTENFNCTLDTPFSSHPVVACEAASNRVAYYIFRTTQVSFLMINTNGYFAAVYDKDVRTDSLLFETATPIHPCNSSIGNIQFCHFQPGTYTLVIFAKDANICRNVTPSIFIDQVGYSRFDFAGNAYDFGTIPPDSLYYFGKPGDINPLHPTRPPSSDFIYCTTGAYSTDPANTACNVTVNGNIYSTADNQPLYTGAFPQVSGNVARRNLWYTFVVDHPGTVRIKVENKTLQRGRQPRFAVYSSDVDPALPFTAVQSGGLVDSTVAAGLRFITMNYITGYYCYSAPNNLSFYRDPCTATPTRYYILVDNVNAIAAEAGGQLPSTQIDVSIQVDSFNLVLPKFDHYFEAADMGTIGAGTFTGEQDNYSCATRRNDPLGTGQNSCSKTLWYKFTSTITGNIRYRIRVGNNVYRSDDNIQLFKETVPGDSSINGLKLQPYANVSTGTGTWAQSCVTTGVYYLLLPGCNAVNEYVMPEIEMIEQEGDFCSRAVPAAITGAGSATASVLVNCHTIGTDYGEFGPSLTCPQGGVTALYKTSWFRMDIGGTDTLDVTTFLTENTNASSSDIKYRMMTGDCGAMQEQSCVLDALTQNTYECLVPGQSYYIQVFTPLTKNNAVVTGTIDLQLSAVTHADTCLPLTNCLATANFLPSFDCTTDESVKLVNYSTFGDNITYQWDLGHNGATSTAVSPSYFYPALPVDSTYTIKLIVTNTSCNKVDSSIRTFTVPARPFIDFGPDIIQCNSTAPVVLRATSHPGATYVWQNNSTADTFRVTATGNNNYRVRVTYNGCVNSDTVRVLISPVSARPLQQINLCTDSVSVDVRRGSGETYRWNTGATTRSIYMSIPGYYWVDITYFDCVYRDSFEVNNVTGERPFGNDTTVCLSNGGFILDATMNGALTYRWQNNSTADTFLVTAAGQYRVEINYGNCSIRDTINITGYPAPLSETTDTSICIGNTYILPSGVEVSNAGTYRDTLTYSGGCDSLIRIVNLTLRAVPNIGNDTAVCVIPDNYVLNAVTTGAVGYNWQDGSNDPTFTVTAPGLYWVQVSHGDCNVTDSVNVVLLSSPILVSVDTTICAGGSITLPSGLVVQNSGSYIDTLISAGGCDSLVRTYNVTVANSPQLGSDNVASICSGQSIDLTTYYNTTALTANWTLSNNPVADPANINAAGNYRLIVFNAGGCSDTAFVSLTVNSRPSLGNDSNVDICEGSTTNLNNAYNTTGLITAWTMGGNPAANPAAVSSAGSYQLIATNSSGCNDTAILTLSVSPKPAVGNDAGVNICQGDTVDLAGFYNTTGLTANWTIGGNTVNNPGEITVAGTYRLIVSNTGGCSDTALVNISFNAKPALGNDENQRICGGNSFNLDNVFNTTGLTLQWTFNNNPVTNTSAVNTAGNYQLIAENNVGCTDTATITLAIDPKPILDIDIDSSNCGNINLTTVYNTAGLSTIWTSNNLPVSNPANTSTAGIYQLIASSAAGCRDTALVTYGIHPKPSLGSNIPVTICQGLSTDLTQLYSTTGLTAQWILNNSPVTNPSAVNTAGTYWLVASNNFNCADTALVTLTINPKPALGNDIVTSICSDGNINLLTQFSTGSNSNTWTSGNLPVSNPASVNTPGTYQLISVNANGCSDTAMVNLSVSTAPTLVITDPAVLCVPQTADLTNAAITAGSSAGLAYTYWQDAAATVAFTNPATAADGTYYIKAANSTGCFTILPVTISSYPVQLVDAGNDKGICDSDSTVVLSAQVSNTTAPVRYEWTPADIGGIQNPAAASTIVKPNATPQQFIVTVTDGYGCNYLISDTVVVTKQPPVAAFAGNDTLAVTGLPHQLQATGGVGYLWEPAGLLNDAAIANPLATIYADSIFFTVIVTDDKGCKGYDTVKIRTYDGITYYVPNAFSPNGDGMNEIFKPIPVGIVSTELFRVFNRYGIIMFETNRYMNGWDGNYKGIPQPVGNYVWVLKGKGRNGKMIEMRGNVVLVR